jgi:hypothetical protein
VRGEGGWTTVGLLPMHTKLLGGIDSGDHTSDTHRSYEKRSPEYGLILDPYYSIHTSSNYLVGGVAGPRRADSPTPAAAAAVAVVAWAHHPAKRDTGSRTRAVAAAGAARALAGTDHSLGTAPEGSTASLRPARTVGALAAAACERRWHEFWAGGRVFYSRVTRFLSMLRLRRRGWTLTVCGYPY